MAILVFVYVGGAMGQNDLFLGRLKFPPVLTCKIWWLLEFDKGFKFGWKINSRRIIRKRNARHQTVLRFVRTGSTLELVLHRGKVPRSKNKPITNLSCIHAGKGGGEQLHARTNAGRMQWGRANSRGLSRGVQQGAIHQGAVVAILDKIVCFAGVAALRRLVGDANLHGVLGVVEINDVNVKDENGRAGDEISCSGKWERGRGYVQRRALKMLEDGRNSPTPSPP